jgi:predicted transcriptional regulator
MKEVLTIRVDPDVKKELEKIAKKQDRTISYIAQLILKQGTNKKQNK